MRSWRAIPSRRGVLSAAAEVDPGYAAKIGPVSGRVWTYMGRAQYSGGDFTAARNPWSKRARAILTILWRALSRLALSKAGDPQTAAKEIRLGLNGLNELARVRRPVHYRKAYWDPGAIIRSQIKDG